MTPELIAHCRELLAAGRPVPTYWQRQMLDEIERMQYAFGEPVAHQTRYTVEPAHAPIGSHVRPTAAPTEAAYDHWRYHAQVIHYPPGDLPGEVGAHLARSQWSSDDDRPDYIRVVALPGWPGWTFDIPADWDPDVPLPCPDFAMLYSAYMSDGELVLAEPRLPDGWVRQVHGAAPDGTPYEVTHVPPMEPPSPGEVPS